MKNKQSASSKLRHRLGLQSEQKTPDSAGGYSRTWAHVAYVWAEIIPVSSKERFFTARVQAESTHRVRIRYREDVTTKHRLVFENRIFSIRGIKNLRELDDLLELAVEEGVES